MLLRAGQAPVLPARVPPQRGAGDGLPLAGRRAEPAAGRAADQHKHSCHDVLLVRAPPAPFYQPFPWQHALHAWLLLPSTPGHRRSFTKAWLRAAISCAHSSGRRGGRGQSHRARSCSLCSGEAASLSGQVSSWPPYCAGSLTLCPCGSLLQLCSLVAILVAACGVARWLLRLPSNAVQCWFQRAAATAVHGLPSAQLCCAQEGVAWRAGHVLKKARVDAGICQTCIDWVTAECVGQNSLIELPANIPRNTQGAPDASCAAPACRVLLSASTLPAQPCFMHRT